MKVILEYFSTKWCLNLFEYIMGKMLFESKTNIKFISGILDESSYHWDRSYASMHIYSSSCFSILVSHTRLWLHSGSKQNVSTIKVTGWWFLSLSVLSFRIFQLDDFWTFSICDLKIKKKVENSKVRQISWIWNDSLSWVLWSELGSLEKHQVLLTPDLSPWQFFLC